MYIQIKVEFAAMLQESEAITERSQWKKIKSLFDRDPRYKAVESSIQREEWFLEHVRSISNRTNPSKLKRERERGQVESYCTRKRMEQRERSVEKKRGTATL